MKKIIDGIEYDTDEARLIGYTENIIGLYQEDCQYFLAKENTRIELLEHAEAYEWAKKYLSAELVEQEFGDIA